ncbi:MAG: hypothetical protein IJY80_05480 [Opitutales bacterium]|nr:hypothetical protein [Opitutales bacterium]
MSNEEKNTSVTPARFLASVFGLGAVVSIFIAAIFGYGSPLTGALFLLGGIVAAVIAFAVGCISGSSFARRCSYIAIGLAILVTLAGTAALIIDKGFEDRCVRDWSKIAEKSYRIERRLEKLEDRFDHD